MKNQRVITTIVFLILGLIFIFWFLVVWKYTRSQLVLPPSDYQRDTAITYNILAGNIFSDHIYIDEYAYYPYLSHLLYAFTSIITHIPAHILWLKYPFVLSIPVLFIFIWSIHKLFKDPLFTLLMVFSFLFIFPQTANAMNVNAHPQVMAFGTIALVIYLFHAANFSKRKIDWIIAGLGISLVIYSHVFAALTICGGIFLYQLLTRQYWKNFFLMILSAFIFSLPYIFPLIFIYKLHTVNDTNLPFLQYGITLDNIFNGYGNLRWSNTFLILSGIFLAIFRRNNLDKLLLSTYFFSLFFIAWGLVTTQLHQPIWISKFQLPPSFVWADLMRYNQFIAIYLFCLGLWGCTKYIFLIFNKIKSEYVFLITFLLIFTLYGYYLIPIFLSHAKNWYTSQQTYIAYDTNWQETVKWISQNTSIHDVFMAHYETSYLFISGLTGRKLVASENWHVSPFVDQKKRVDDLLFLYNTNDIEKFISMARKYKISYIVVSPHEESLTHDGIQKFSSQPIFKPVFSSGPIRLYKLNIDNSV